MLDAWPRLRPSTRTCVRRAQLPDCSVQGRLLAMSSSEAAELRAAAAEKAALLAAAEERLARLEALHRIAQDTALKGEAQLEDTLAALTSLGKLANLDRIEAANAKCVPFKDADLCESTEGIL